MATKPSTPKIVVVLKLAKRIGDFIIQAGKIRDQMTANAKVLPSPNPALTKLSADIADLVTKQSAVKSRTAGSTADRDAAMKLVEVDLGTERAYVEQVANGDPANAASIADDAGMALKKVPVRNKPPLAAKPATVLGSVRLTALATKGAKTNNWQYSTDGGKTWVDLPQTTKASTIVPSLMPGATVMFRQRAVTKTGPGNWSEPVSTIVA